MLIPGGHEETTSLPDQAQILVLTRFLHANRYPLRWKRLVPDKPAPAEAATVVSAASTKTAVPAAANKTAPEVNLGRRYTILPAQLAQQCVDALVIALDRCARPMQLQDSRQNLQRGNRHIVVLLLAAQ
jgi:hypothetical protein